MNIRREIEPLLIEANEIANSIGQNVHIDLEVAGDIRVNTMFTGEKLSVDELLQTRQEKL